jgi:hypothetical protein
MITTQQLTKEYNAWVSEHGMGPAASGLTFGRHIQQVYGVEGGNSTQFSDPFEAWSDILIESKAVIFPPRASRQLTPKSFQAASRELPGNTG